MSEHRPEILVDPQRGQVPALLHPLHALRVKLFQLGLGQPPGRDCVDREGNQQPGDPDTPHILILRPACQNPGLSEQSHLRVPRPQLRFGRRRHPIESIAPADLRHALADALGVIAAEKGATLETLAVAAD
jgi:hypothetical protein